MLLRGDNIQNRSQAGGESFRLFQADGKSLATMSGDGGIRRCCFYFLVLPISSPGPNLRILFCQGWAHWSHSKRNYASCGVDSPV